LIAAGKFNKAVLVLKVRVDLLSNLMYWYQYYLYDWQFGIWSNRKLHDYARTTLCLV
jgi:hypothetical protein